MPLDGILKRLVSVFINAASCCRKLNENSLSSNTSSAKVERIGLQLQTQKDKPGKLCL